MVNIELNTSCRRETRIIGNEKTPVLTLDELVLSTDALVQYASRHAEFDSGGEAYPGIRADLPIEYPRVLMPELVGLISHVYNIPRSFKPYLIHHLFSLVTRQPGDLEPLQRRGLAVGVGGQSAATARSSPRTRRYSHSAYMPVAISAKLNHWIA